MSQTGKKNLVITSIALYFTYFIHGIGASIMGQYKPELAAHWGAKALSDGTMDVSMVVSVIAALGLGRLISLPFSGPLSDKFGRRLSGIIGVICYAAYFMGIAFAPSMGVAYAFAIVGGIANSFLDTCVSPTCMEIYVNNPSVANLFTKFAISMAQFLLPFLITFVAARDMSFRTLYFLAAGIIIVDGIFLAILPFPPKEEAPKAADGTVEKRKMKLTPSAILLVCIGFTASTTFMLFMNCNQELGKLYGMANPSMIQSFYSAGIICAVLLTAALMKKGLKPIRVLVIYPCVAFCALLLMYFVQIPQICMIGGFLIGYFAAGGVLQLATSTANEMFPRDKGKITAVVMIASSIANYAVLNVASLLSKVGGVEGPRYILLFNAVVTAIGIVFAIILNLRFEKDAQ